MNLDHHQPPQLDLSERLRAERRQRGWNQNELARRAGVSRTTLYYLEQGGVVEPRGQTLGRVARALGLTVDELLSPPEKRTESPARKFDEETNPLVTEVAHATPQLFVGWSDWDWDELYSTFGVGGALSAEGVRVNAERINRRRELVRRLQIVLETDLSGVAEAVVNSLYEQLQQKSRGSGRNPAADGS